MKINAITLFIVAVFALSILSAAAAAEMKQVRTGASVSQALVNGGHDENKGNVKTIAKVMKGTDKRMRICVDFVRKNGLSDTPVITCEKILKKELKCAEFLENAGMANPVKTCDMLFSKTAKIIKKRVYLPEKITSTAPEWLLKRADDVVKKYPKAEAFIKSLGEDKAKIFMRLSRARQKEIIEKGKEGLKELSRYRLRAVEKDMLYKKRIIAKEKLDKARRVFEKAKKEYARANNAYKEKRQLFLQEKKKLADCEGTNSTECNELRDKVREYAKQFTIHAAEMIINHLDKIKTKVEASDSIDEDTAQEIIGDISKAIEKLKGVINDTQNAQTKDEIKDAARKIDAVWKRIRFRERVYAGRLLNAKIWKVFKKGEHLEDRLDAKLAEMEEEGLDVSSLKEKLGDYSEKVESAKAKYEEAKNLLIQAHRFSYNGSNNETNITSLINDAKNLINEARSELKDAYKLARDIIKGIKDMVGTLNIASADTTGQIYEVVEATRGINE
ncbi:MAG: hypothetical protein GXO64_01190 [Candidatus Micrarchaeota archaeon]|nr:hypothetical protein [Candidatus Micrarchaeota archaeon]